MTMQQPTYRPNTRPQKNRSGNYHRIHEALLNKADKDGVFQTTEVIRKLTDELGVGFSSASSSAFQWSDPTGQRGYRRIRLYSPRKSSACPAEMVDKTTPPKVKTWAHGVKFPPAPGVNKRGEYYLTPGTKPRGETRADQLLRCITELAPSMSDGAGFWMLSDMVAALAGKGFQPFSVYKMVVESLENGTMEKRGRFRRVKPSAAASFNTEAVNTEAVNDGVRFDAPSPLNHLKVVNETPALDGLITQMIQKKLEQPETLSLIDGFIKKRIEEALRKQLGL